MIIDCISDLHGFKPKLPGGDLLILAGDYTEADTLPQWEEFYRWLKEQPYEKKIMIAGNHDNLLKIGFPKNQEEADDLKDVVEFLGEKSDFEYLCDSGTEYEGLKIWGTPWTPWFYGVNPKCKVFMESEEIIAKRFQLIPNDIDILITHGPPYGILDELDAVLRPRVSGMVNAGSKSLRNVVLDGKYFTKLKFHVFGHIHEQGGKSIATALDVKFVNASHVNEYYKPTNEAIRIVWTHS